MNSLLVVVRFWLNMYLNFEEAINPLIFSRSEGSEILVHLSSEKIERYRKREMSAAELLVASDHVAGCEDCRRLLRDPEQLQIALAALQFDLSAEPVETPHISYEALAAYVDNCADEVDREIVQSHLEFCSECAEEMDDLREFKASMRSDPVKEAAPATRLALWDSITPLWRTHAPRFVLQSAVTAAIAIVGIWIIMLPLRDQVSDLRAQLGSLRQRNEELETQLSTLTDLQAQLAQLQQSQAQILSSSPQILVALQDGDRLVTLDRQGNLTGLESLGPEARQKVKVALTAQRLETPPELASIITGTGRLLGAGGQRGRFALLSPVGTVVEADRPALRWQALNGATGYVVAIYDSNYNEAVRSEELRATQWTPAQSLSRGGVYSWQVIAIKAGGQIKSPAPPTPEAKFKVLEQAGIDELGRARRAYANSHLVLGIIYASFGLMDDAERELKALRAANPKSSVAQKLLSSLRAPRRIGR